MTSTTDHITEHSCPLDENKTAKATGRDRLAFWLKWGASVIQILGYGATAFGHTPLNLYLFIVGVFGWFAVGVLWNDRAIMLIHVVALMSMLAGLAAGAGG